MPLAGGVGIWRIEWVAFRVEAIVRPGNASRLPATARSSVIRRAVQPEPVSFRAVTSVVGAAEVPGPIESC